MATTKIIPMHRNRGKTILQSISARTDYVMNSDKTDGGELISSYGCEPATADVEFLLAKEQYQLITGRDSKSGGDVIAYQVRQAFYPGEITPEEANRIGYELAMKFTGGNHQFIVATHIDKAHVHNHIVFNSTTLDCTHKFNNYRNSADVIRNLSDQLCMENGLSVITEPAEKGKKYAEWNAEKTGTSWKAKLKKAIDESLPGCTSFEQFLVRMEQAGYEVKRGKHISFRAPDQKRFTRAKTLGAGYSQAELEAKITEYRAAILSKKKLPKNTRDVNFLINLQKIIDEGKGPGYERWAKLFNLKSLANALIEYNGAGLTSLEELDTRVETLTADFDYASDQLRATEAELRQIKEMRQHIINYGRTRETYTAYRKAKHPEQFYEEHRADITIHLAAKKFFDEAGMKPLPKIKTLDARRKELSVLQKKQYQQYRSAREEMQKWQAVKQNFDTAYSRVEKEKHRGLDR